MNEGITRLSSITATPRILFCFLMRDFFLLVELDFFFIGVEKIGLKRVLLGDVRSPSGRSSMEFVLSSSIRMISLLCDGFDNFFRFSEGLIGNFKRMEFDFNLQIKIKLSKISKI